METIAIHESKTSEKVVKFIELTIDALSKYCSVKYAKQIIDCHENGSLWGIYLTPSGKIRATFI